MNRRQIDANKQYEFKDMLEHIPPRVGITDDKRSIMVEYVLAMKMDSHSIGSLLAEFLPSHAIHGADATDTVIIEVDGVRSAPIFARDLNIGKFFSKGQYDNAHRIRIYHAAYEGTPPFDQRQQK